MERSTIWRVEISMVEDGERTRAEAVLTTEAGIEYRAAGIARRNPRDPDVPAIGEELAASRALSGLAHELFEATVADVEQNVQHVVQLRA